MLNFDVTANTKDFAVKMDAVMKQVEQTASVMKSLGKDFDMSKPAGQIASLQKVIAGNEQAIERNSAMIRKWQNDAREAFSSGDWGTFNAITQDIRELSNETQNLINETNTYKQALSNVESISGVQQSQATVEAPKLFKDQSDYDYAERLKAKIAELRQQIATFEGSDADLQGLKNQLLSAQTELDGVNAKAEQAATQLGASLGGKAAEATTKLYQLNNAVKSQQTAVDSLKAELDKATEAYKNMDQSADPQKTEDARVKVDSLRNAYASATAELNNLKAAQSDAKAAVDSMSGALTASGSTLTRMLGGYGNLQAMLGKLPAPLAGAVTGITGMTGAAKMFIATPLGAIIGAIVIALQTLYKWLNSTKEGQMAMAKVTGYLGGVLQGLTNIAFAVGKAIYNAFTDPKKAISDLWAFLKSQLVNRVKAVGGIFTGLGKVIMAAFSFDADKIKAALKDYTNSWLQLGTGVENTIGKVSDAIDKLHKKGSEGAAIAADTRKLAKEKSEWEVARAKLQRQIQEQYAVSRSKKYSTSQRSSANDAIRKLNQQITQGDLSINSKEVSLQERRMKQKGGNTSAEDEAQLRNLKKRTEELKTQGLQRNNALSRLDNSLLTAEQSALKKEDTLKQKRIKMQEDLAKSLEALYVKEEQTRVKGLEDTYEKQVEALKAARTKLVAEQLKTAREMSGKNAKLGQGSSVSFGLPEGGTSDQYTLTEEQQKVLRQIIDNAGSEYMRKKAELDKARLDKEKETHIRLLSEYGDYAQKKLAIDLQLRKDIQDVMADKTLTETARNEMVEILTRQADEAANKLKEQYKGATQAMADLFGDASKKSVSEIQKIIDKYEVLIAYLDGNKEGKTEADLKALGFSDKDLENLKKGETSLKDITDAIEKLKGTLGSKSPFQKFKKDMESAFSALSKAGKSGDTAAMGTAITNIGDAVNGFLPSVKEFGSDIANIFGASDDKISGCIDGLSGMATAGQGVGQIMSGDVLGGVMSVASGISQVVDAFEGMFGADYSGYEKMKARYDELTDVWNTLIERKREYVDMSYGAEAQKAAEEIKTLYEKQADATRTLGKKYLNSGASAGSSSIGKRQWKNMTKEARAELEKIYGADYESALGSTRMTKLFDMSADELRNLQENATTFWAGLSGTVREYLENIIEYDEAITDTIASAKEAELGVSFDSFRDSFLSTLQDMDKGSQDFADDFEEYMKNAILSSLLANEYKDRLEALYDKWYEASKTAHAGGSEISETVATQLKEEEAAIVNSLLADRDSLAKTFGWSSSSQQSASSGAFESMSEDTAQELNGRFTALQIAGETIAGQVVAGVEQLTMIAGLASSANGYLSDILTQHATSNAYLEDMVKYAKKTYTDFGDKIDRLVTNTNNL